MNRSSKYIIITSFGGIIACIGDIAVTFVLGGRYPGYSQLKDTMSRLGASSSPVAFPVSFWWVIMGMLMIFFGTGFYRAFSGNNKYVNIASLSIVLYGLGEGIGSAAFKATHLPHGYTISLIIHDSIGGIGLAAILALPIIMQKVITKAEMPGFHRLSKIIFIFSIITLILFLFRYSTNEDNAVVVYKGLWQRLLMLNTYIYLTTIAFLMIRGGSGARPRS